MDKTKSLVQALKERLWENAEYLWLEILEEGVSSLSPFQELLHELWRQGQRKRALELMSLTCQACEKSDLPAFWVQTLRLLAEYHPMHPGLATDFARAFKRLHVDLPYITEWVDRISTQKLSPTALIQKLDKLVFFREGMVVKHKSGWGVGTVVGIQAESMEIIVDLQHRPNHRMDVLAAAEYLFLMDAECFEALVVLQPDRLKKEANEQPLQLIYRLLKSSDDSLGTRELKQLICPAVVEEAQWTKWWGKVRKLLLADPYIEVLGGSHARYAMREKPLEWEEEMQIAFQRTEVLEQPGFVLSYLKNTTEKKHLNSFASALVDVCRFHRQQQKVWYALEAYLVIQQCVAQGADLPPDLPHPKDILGDQAIVVLANLRLPNLAQETLQSCLAVQSDWIEHLETVFREGTDLVRNTLFRYLKTQRELMPRLHQLFQRIIDNPLVFSDALAWLVTQVASDRLALQNGMPDLIDLCKISIQTATTLRFLRQPETAKRLRAIFSLHLANKIVKLVDNQRAMALYTMADYNVWLPQTFRETVLLHIREHFAELFTRVMPIYTTEVGLSKYQKELEDLMQNKIPENIKAIGVALSFGDISENAELDAAREIQFQLADKAQQMRTNIERAKLIDFKTVTDDHVDIGTQVKLVNDQGQECQYTILGPWDMELSQRIISFMSPVAEKLLGKRRGQTVTLPEGTFNVADIQVAPLEEAKKIALKEENAQSDEDED